MCAVQSDQVSVFQLFATYDSAFPLLQLSIKVGVKLSIKLKTMFSPNLHITIY